MYNFDKDREEIQNKFALYEVWPTTETVNKKDDPEIKRIIQQVMNDYLASLKENDIEKITEEAFEYFYDCKWLKPLKEEVKEEIMEENE